MSTASRAAASVLIVCTTVPIAAQAFESLPASIQGNYAAVGFSPPFCAPEINQDGLFGFFDGGGSCKPVFLRQVNTPNNGVQEAFQGSFTCFHDGSEWTSTIAIWRFADQQNLGDAFLSVVFNLDMPDGSAPAVMVLHQCDADGQN